MAERLPNRAFVFVKPHAAAAPGVLAFVEETLSEHGIDIVARGSLSGPEIGARGIVDRHYAAIADYGALRQPADLPITDASRTAFRQTSGLEWDPGDARNAMQFLQETGLGAMELNTLWEASRFVKLAPGLYASRIAAPNGTVRTVVNGFYPSMRLRLTATGGNVAWLDTVFAPEKLCWRTFRGEVIGATNPAAAAPNSIRGRLFAEPESFGLAERPTVQQNGIHASAGPLEAAREQVVWLGPGAGGFPLLDALRRKGLDDARILALLENPVIERHGKRQPAFDALEDVDARDALAVLLDNAARGLV